MLLNGQVELILLAVILAWLLGLSFLFYRLKRYHSRLIDKTGRTDLRGILERLISNQETIEGHIKKLEDALSELERGTQKDLQKVGVVRFNPFSGTGGDQSFALALLDNSNSGVILLSLHGREGTRIYAKPVKNGKSRYELSKEEKRAIESASRNR